MMDPKSYELVISDGRKIKPEVETDEDEASNFDYIEMDKQFDPIGDVIEGTSPRPIERAEEYNLAREEPPCENIPEESLMRQGVFVDLAVVEINMNDLIFPNSHQKKFTNESNTLHQTPKKLRPVRHAKRLAYMARQKQKTVENSAPKGETLIPSINLPAPKYNLFFKDQKRAASVSSLMRTVGKKDKEAEIIERRREQYAKRLAPPKTQRSRSLTSLDVAQYIKTLNSKRYQVEPKIDTGKQAKWREQRRHSLNFVKINKESIMRLNRADHNSLLFDADSPTKPVMRRARSSGKLEPLDHKNGNIGVWSKEINPLFGRSNDGFKQNYPMVNNLFDPNYQSMNYQSPEPKPAYSYPIQTRSRSTDSLNKRKENFDGIFNYANDQQKTTWIASNLYSSPPKQVLNPLLANQRSKSSLPINTANTTTQSQNSWIASRVNSTDLKSLPESPKSTKLSSGFLLKKAMERPPSNASAELNKINDNSNNLERIPFILQRSRDLAPALERSHSSGNIRAHSGRGLGSPGWVASHSNTRMIGLSSERRPHRRIPSPSYLSNILLSSQSYYSSPQKHSKTQGYSISSDAQTNYLLKKSAEYSVFRHPSLSRQILDQ